MSNNFSFFTTMHKKESSKNIDSKSFLITGIMFILMSIFSFAKPRLWLFENYRTQTFISIFGDKFTIIFIYVMSGFSFIIGSYCLYNGLKLLKQGD